MGILKIHEATALRKDLEIYSNIKMEMSHLFPLCPIWTEKTNHGIGKNSQRILAFPDWLISLSWSTWKMGQLNDVKEAFPREK